MQFLDTYSRLCSGKLVLAIGMRSRLYQARYHGADCLALPKAYQEPLQRQRHLIVTRFGYGLDEWEALERSRLNLERMTQEARPAQS